MKNPKHIEIELKFPLLNHKELIEKLNFIANVEREREFQKDIYFNPPHKDFSSKNPVSEWLRLRESKKGFSLNYKKWHNENGKKAISCDEFQTKIDDIKAFKKILENLKFRKLVSVEKIRNIWSYKSTEIAIDEVKYLGNFIEIEAKGNFSDIEQAKKHLYKVLQELEAKIGEQDFQGYPYLLLKKKGLI